jgi:hypothetical protein
MKRDSSLAMHEATRSLSSWRMSQEGRCSTIGVRERNAVGAVKAIAAASLALHGDGQHRRWTASSRRCARPAPTCSRSTKETSLGGLAVNFVEC